MSDNGQGELDWEKVDFSNASRPAPEGVRDVPPTVRSLLRRYGFRPRKKLGQNFLVDEDILDGIAEAADLTPADEVLEVGPGLGTLTLRLARRAGRLVAVELDDDLVRIVRETVAGTGNVTVVHQDILKFDPSRYFAPRAYKMIGNLPYYVTSPTLRHFLENPSPPSLLLLMIQREVADRLLARPGELSLLAISVQLYAEPRLVRLVDAGAFYPSPKVDSAVIRLDVLPQPAVAVDTDHFFAVVSAGFSQPRKQLHNSLAQRFWMRPGQSTELLHEAGIDPKRRAQTLALEEWAELTQVFERQGIIKPSDAGGGASST
ncbi:MAG: 16S rRNA (adenine(1518)-N(6)/adenine(1519)-N(6))-dimethyltransferase RsmA [Chloroflexota bacterium]